LQLIKEYEVGVISICVIFLVCVVEIGLTQSRKGASRQMHELTESMAIL